MSDKAREWLKGWINRNLMVPQHIEHPADMAAQMMACRIDAQVAGVSEEDLSAAADGDLLKHLLQAQNDYQAQQRRLNKAD